MRLPPWALLVGGLVVIGALLVVAVIAASDDDDPDASAATNTPTPTADDFGPPPNFTDHIVGVRPEHGGKVKQSQTIETASGQTGICADVTYQDLPQNNLMFIMAIDGEIVVEDTSIILTRGTLEAPEAGTICYGGSEPLALGIHDAAIAVQDPNNLSGPASEVVGWKFEVIE